MIQPQSVDWGSPSLEPRRVSIFVNLGIEPRPVRTSTAFCRATVVPATTLLLIDVNLGPRGFEPRTKRL